MALRDEPGSSLRGRADLGIGVLVALSSGLKSRHARRASAAYMKRCHGRLAISFLTNGPISAGTSGGSAGLGERRVAVLLEQLLVGARVRLAVRQQREQDATERVQIRRRADVRGGEADLLRRHPPRGARAVAHRRLRLGRPVEAVIDAVLA
jgi:hypothetical protein